jgi:hypothetical protein
MPSTHIEILDGATSLKHVDGCRDDVSFGIRLDEIEVDARSFGLRILCSRCGD